jgi:colicin import membrane protein
VADPEAAELQIEAVTSQAAEQVATAEARASRAEQAQRRAEAERAEAEGAAKEASALSEQLRAGLDESSQRLAMAHAERDRVIAELADARATVEAEREQSSARLLDLAERLTVTEARLVEAHADRDAATQRAEAALVAQSEAEERSRNAVERIDAESQRAARAEDAVESLRRDLVQAERRSTDLRAEIGDLRGKLATMTAQRDAAVHDAERETVHGQQRVDDLRARHEEGDRRLREEFVELRGELNAAREEASVRPSRPIEPKPDSTAPPSHARPGAPSRSPGVDGVEARARPRGSTRPVADVEEARPGAPNRLMGPSPCRCAVDLASGNRAPGFPDRVRERPRARSPPRGQGRRGSCSDYPHHASRSRRLASR